MLYVHLHNPSKNSSLRMVFVGNTETYKHGDTYVGQILIRPPGVKAMKPSSSLSQFDNSTKALNHLIGHKDWKMTAETGDGCLTGLKQSE